MRVLSEDFLHLGVGLVDILRIARQRRPAEGADAAAEQRADVGGHETGEVESVLQPFLQRHLADVVAIVDRGDARGVEIDHCLHLHLHRGTGGFFDGFGIALTFLAPFAHRPALRQVAVHRVMGRGLVGHDIGADPAFHQFGKDICRIAQKRHGLRLARGSPAVDHRQRFLKAVGLFIDIAGAQAEIDAVGIALHRQTAGPGHDRGQRLRAAHAAQAPGEDPFAFEITAIVLAARLDEGLIGALDDALAADVDPRSGGHLTVHR